MRLVTRILALSRAARLYRQFRDIEQRTRGLPAPSCSLLAELINRECAAAGRTDAPHLYGSQGDLKSGDWGTGTDLGYERARSDNAQVRLRGVALWMAVAYHETRDAGFPEFEGLHREILRFMRQVKENAAPPMDGVWTRTKSEAAA
jgi:hypothetical protein